MDQVIGRIPETVIFWIAVGISTLDIGDEVRSPIDLAGHQSRLGLRVVRILAELDAIQIRQPLIGTVIVRVATDLDLVIAHRRHFGDRTRANGIAVPEGDLILDILPDVLRRDVGLLQIPVERRVRAIESNGDGQRIDRFDRGNQRVRPFARLVQCRIFGAEIERTGHVFGIQNLAIRQGQAITQMDGYRRQVVGISETFGQTELDLFGHDIVGPERLERGPADEIFLSVRERIEILREGGGHDWHGQSATLRMGALCVGGSRHPDGNCGNRQCRKKHPNFYQPDL